MPIAYRFGKAKHSQTANRMLSGVGGLYGSARWHTQGHRMVYTSSVASLAMLEMVVNETGGSLLPYYKLLKIGIPEELVEVADIDDLPPSWNVVGPAPTEARKYGNEWYDSFRSCVLCVPSVIQPVGVTANEINYLINPEHDDFEYIEVLDGPIDVTFDPRIKS